MDTRRQTNYDHKIALIDMKVLNHKCWAQNKTFGLKKWSGKVAKKATPKSK